MHKLLPKLDLNITNRCNFRCEHCAFDSGCKDMDEMTKDELTLLLKETKELGGTKIDITGGEPTIRQDHAKIIQIAKNLDYKVELVTNGSLLNRGKLAYLHNLGLDSIAVSIDGSTYATHTKIRRCRLEQYTRAKQTIDDALAEGLVVKVNTVVRAENIGDIPQIAAYCIDRGVHEQGLYYFTPVGRGKNNLAKCIDPKEWLSIIRERLVPYAEQMKISVEIPMHESIIAPCLLHEDPYHLQVLPDGNVYPCAILASYDRAIGNLNRRGVKQIWNDEKVWKSYRDAVDQFVFAKWNDFCFPVHESWKGYRDLHPVCPLRKFDPREI